MSLDKHGGYIDTVDKKGQIVEVNSLNYDSHLRTTLRLIDQIRDRNGFLIDWEKPVGHIYLNDHPHLIDYLKYCNNLVDQDMVPLQYSDSPAAIVVKVVEDSPGLSYSSEVIVQSEKDSTTDYHLISSNHLLIDQIIYRIPDLGHQYGGLGYFSSNVPAQQLSLFLSLLFTHLESFTLDFAGYDVIHTDEIIEAKPALFFRAY